MGNCRCRKRHKRYAKRLRINGLQYKEIEICRHYEEKHGSYIHDDLILEVVHSLDGTYLEADAQKKVGNSVLSYFAADVDYEEQVYRLVWRVVRGRIKLLVVNCY